jgi:hypothetical protein
MIWKSKLELISEDQIEKIEDEPLPTIVISLGSFIQASGLFVSINKIYALQFEFLGRCHCIIECSIYFLKQ